MQLLIDGSDSNTAAIAQGYAESLVATTRHAGARTPRFRRAGRSPRTGVTPEVRVWYNPDLLSRNYIVPGLIVVI